MAIRYTMTEKAEPGVLGGGTKKWYARVIMDGEISIDDLSKQIEKFSALSEPDIRGVIIALENVIQEYLVNGKVIRMDKLGSFYPGLSSGGAATKEEFNSTFIKEAYVTYRPGQRIRDALKTATFKKTE
ncbi:HU family DNA-binding protein [Pedobacter chitinilyticus]|uniref:DNA-binding protein n=1 Tax=Pedobacter chitinilyticus TaxID=2233776 RepID=A0A443YUZ8_9SPHI|nr:HU family DNA-binding protein [Pedobacter chitinilyticus]RWU07688.1 DNA-binding protein [Pedobacter chitinilyticus]